MSDINVTEGIVLESLNNKVDLDGRNYIGSGLQELIGLYGSGDVKYESDEEMLVFGGAVLPTMNTLLDSINGEEV